MNELIEVFLWPEIKVGNVYFRFNNGKESSTFEYSNEWLSDKKNAFALEPALELYPTQYHIHNMPLFGSLSDSAPDRWGRTLIIRNERKRAESLGKNKKTLTEIDFLLGVNDETRQGALRFKIKSNTEFLSTNKKNSIPPLISLPGLLNATERMLNSRESSEDLKILLHCGSSLGGARPKASIYNDNELSIAKFPKNDDEYNVILWEAHSLHLAKNAGLKVPEWFVERIAGKPVLILKRFDRKGKQRIPFISAMTMLGAKDQEQHSYIEIAHIIINHGAEPQNDLEELWRRMVFNISISNIDDHLRNHGFLLNTTKGWELSPAYDMNPVPRHISPDFHTLSIDQSSAEGLIDTAFSVIDEFRIKKDKAHTLFSDVHNAIKDWKNIARFLNIPKEEINMMKSAFTGH